MLEMDGPSNSKPPQLSEMFQKFALAVKSKTIELFAEEEAAEDSDGFSLLDSAEEVISDQKVVVIKPDPIYHPSGLSKFTPEKPLPAARARTVDAQMVQTLISSIFATISSFEASYLQLQTAHVPFDEEKVTAADRALVSHLLRLSDFKGFYIDFCKNSDLVSDFSVGSSLEAQVQENQSKLRTLGIVSDRLQADIDQKDSDVLALRKKLGEMQSMNLRLSKKLSGSKSLSADVLLSVGVFDSLLHDACREAQKFAKILAVLMRRANWDMDLAANLVHPHIEYDRKSHSRYAFLSYICLGMFRGFNLEGFGLAENKVLCNGNSSTPDKNDTPLKQLLEHASSNPMELLSRDRDCEFSRYCERKYQQLIHPTMESSIFSNLDRKEAVLSSWRSLSVFYESFVKMASSIWTLHKLALSFDPVVEIFQVEKGADFSMVYMEDVTKRFVPLRRDKAKVGFTVVPGFRIGKTVIQSKVYLCSVKGKDGDVLLQSSEHCGNGDRGD